MTDDDVDDGLDDADREAAANALEAYLATFGEPPIPDPWERAPDREQPATLVYEGPAEIDDRAPVVVTVAPQALPGYTDAGWVIRTGKRKRASFYSIAEAAAGLGTLLRNWNPQVLVRRGPP